MSDDAHLTPAADRVSDPMGLRSPWGPVMVTLASVMGLCAVAAAAGSDNPLGRIVFGVGAACFLYLAGRSALAPVLLEPDTLRLREVFRSRPVDRDLVTAVEAGVIDHRGTWVWAPEVQLANGGRFPLRRLAGYSVSADRPNRRVVEQVRVLEEWRERGERPTPPGR